MPRPMQHDPARTSRIDRELDPFGSLPRTVAALDAALDAIGSAALIAGTDGDVLKANAAARALLLESDPRQISLGIRDAIARRPSRPSFEITALEASGLPQCFLAVAREDAPEATRSNAIARRAASWRLTKREIDVLDLVARGMTNATMASMLGISERTIEFHLSRLFDKAGAETRSALVSRLLGA